jgi:hypothetical protein
VVGIRVLAFFAFAFTLGMRFLEVRAVIGFVLLLFAIFLDFTDRFFGGICIPLQSKAKQP